MRFRKRKLVPVAPLKSDLVSADLEKTASPQTLRIAPFENGPFSVLKQVFDDASHLRGRKASAKHSTDGGASLNGASPDPASLDPASRDPASPDPAPRDPNIPADLA